MISSGMTPHVGKDMGLTPCLGMFAERTGINIELTP